MKVQNDKELGVFVELDPQKKYIMLIDETCLTEEEAASIRIENGLVIYARDIQKGITFVEYSDNIVGIQRV